MTNRLTALCLALAFIGCAPSDAPTGSDDDDGRSRRSDAGGIGGHDSGLRDAAPPPDESCDGFDNDRDGTIDDGCTCVPGATQTCYPSLPSEIGVGPCARGTQHCVGVGEFGGSWEPCVGAVTPIAEICGDGADNDCNGTPDDGILCSCTPGATRACFSGATSERGVGICRDGMQTCSTDGTGWSGCVGDTVSVAEVCGNGMDDDCDASTDEGCACAPGMPSSCYSGAPSEVGVGPCRAGTQTCSPDGSGFTACVGEVLPATEVCDNGVDDDCDGTADDGCTRIVSVPIYFSGDCVYATCPPDAPHPVGCDISMAGDDRRGCAATFPGSSLVFFKEGDNCGRGAVYGSITCSSVRGAGLNPTTCNLHKPSPYYPLDRSGCPGE